MEKKLKRVFVVDWCCVCNNGESVDHLLHFEVANALRSTIFSFVGLSWAMPKWVVDLFACWRGLNGNPHSAAVWKILLSCLLCCLWKEKNDRSFEDRKKDGDGIEIFLLSLYHWRAALEILICLVFIIFLTIFLFLARYFFCILYVYLVQRKERAPESA